MTTHARTALFAYPAKGAFGRVVPKTKLYEHGMASARLKGLFAEQVEQIVWQYKLAPETTNLPASLSAPEIQVFGMRLRTSDLHYDVLRCIDNAIPFPIVFELRYENRLQVVACYKRPGEVEARRWVCSDYFAADWTSAESPRVALPVALSLGGLYEQLLHVLIPLTPRSTESLIELQERASRVQALQREVSKTIAKLETERQFNRKVEINTQLRLLRDEFEALTK